MTTIAHSGIHAGENAGSGIYVASDIKRRHRRTKTDVVSIKDAILEILSADSPQTVRQVFYALTVRGTIRKEEVEYQRTVVRLLTEMREAGTIPFDWIADNTRWMRKPATFVGLDACLRNTAKLYRRNLWAAMPVYVEVWCEKDALAGVLMEETDPYDVPLMVSKGYASISFVHSAAETIAAKGKPAHIYHFGDMDPSGQDAARDIEAKLRRYAAAAKIHFERIAVTQEQIGRWDLPKRPTKMTDSRAKTFGRATSVELDAIPARLLRELVKGCIERHIDQEQLRVLRVAEQSERETLGRWAEMLNGGASGPPPMQRSCWRGAGQPCCASSLLRPRSKRPRCRCAEGGYRRWARLQFCAITAFFRWFCPSLTASTATPGWLYDRKQRRPRPHYCRTTIRRQNPGRR